MRRETSGIVHHFAQHHEHGFENVVRIGREFVPPLAVTFGIAFHGQVEQAFLVAEHLVERPLRHPSCCAMSSIRTA